MRINFITTTRADWSIFLPLIRAVNRQINDYRILVFGTNHAADVENLAAKEKLSCEVLSFPFIEKPKNTEEIIRNFLSLNDSMLKIDFRNDHDYILVLGDRYELIPIVSSAFMLNLKIVHFCGGDRTLGSKDDIIRDVISNFSNYHFVTNETSQKRLVGLNIESKVVMNVGHIPLQNLSASSALPNDIFDTLKIPRRLVNILVTLHPDTTETIEYNLRLVDHLITALDAVLDDQSTVLFTGSNADEGAILMEERIKERIKDYKRYYFIDNLGVDKFLATLNSFQVFVGNSSSIFYEAPEFPIVCLNIGNRQTGRQINKSIVHSEITIDCIINGLRSAIEKYPMPVLNPYKNSSCIQLIMNKLLEWQKSND